MYRATSCATSACIQNADRLRVFRQRDPVGRPLLQPVPNGHVLVCRDAVGDVVEEVVLVPVHEPSVRYFTGQEVSAPRWSRLGRRRDQCIELQWLSCCPPRPTQAQETSSVDGGYGLNPGL